MSKTLRPCDCMDAKDSKRLNESGIGWNSASLTVKPNVVVLKLTHTEVTIPMHRFKQFAEWYLTPQEIEQ